MQCDKTLQDLCGIDFPYSADRDQCPVDYSLRLINQLQTALCGKGVFCRDGAAQLEKILDDIVAGEGKSGDIELIKEICTAMLTLADCDLSKSVIKQIAEQIDLDRETWEAHIARRRCPTLRCAKLSLFYIDPASCSGCGKCAVVCPEGAVEGGADMIHIITRRLCSRCGKCETVCPAASVKRADVAGVPPKIPSEPAPVGSFKVAAAGTGLRKGLRK